MLLRNEYSIELQEIPEVFGLFQGLSEVKGQAADPKFFLKLTWVLSFEVQIFEDNFFLLASNLNFAWENMFKITQLL